MIKIKRKNLIFLIILALVLGVFAVVMSVRLVSALGKVNAPGGVVLDKNVELVARSEGAYIKRVDGKDYVFVNSKTDNDYIEIDTQSFDFKKFANSNHTKIIFSFDVMGHAKYAVPNMFLSVDKLYQSEAGGNEKLWDYLTLKLSSIDTHKFSASAAYSTADVELLGAEYEAKISHHVSLSISKTDVDNVYSVSISIDDKSATYSEVLDSEDFTIESLRIDLTSPYKNNSNVSAVRIENYSLTYVPSAEKYDADEIIVDDEAALLLYEENGKPNPGLFYAKEGTVSTVLGDSVHGDYYSTNITDNDKNAYINYYFLKDINAGIKMSDYNYVVIEFDLFSDGDCVPECYMYMIGRSTPQVGSAVNVRGSTVYLNHDVAGDGFYLLNYDKSYMSIPALSTHVKYVFDIKDPDDLTATTLQIYFDGVLKYEHSSMTQPVLTEDFGYLTELRFLAFESAGKIVLDNLKVSAYAFE